MANKRVQNHKIYIFDSSALLSFIRDEDGAERVLQLLELAEKRKVRIIMPLIQYGEVVYIANIRGNHASFSQTVALLETLPIEYPQIDKSSVIVASQYKLRGGLAYPECFLIAIALQYQGVIVTKDSEFKKFEKELSVEWL